VRRSVRENHARKNRVSLEKALKLTALALLPYFVVKPQGDDVMKRHRLVFHLMSVHAQQIEVTRLFALGKI
jgi:hypothetical protein